MTKQDMLREAIGALERLEVAEGRLAKEAILYEQRDNLALQTIIKMAIGPDRYFVRPSVNIVPLSALSPSNSWRAFRDLTDKLKNRQLTGNEAKKQVHRFLAQCRPMLLKWYCRIFNHDLRCGVDRHTVQKIWGARFLLSDSAIGVEWNYNGCALAKKYEDVYKKTKRGERKPQFPLGLEPKLDGERANLICFPRDNAIYVLTRSGRRRESIEAVSEYRDQVLAYCRVLNNGVNPDRPLFLDGEFLARKWNDTSSIVRKTKNFNPEQYLKEVRTFLWDWAPLDRYLAGRFDAKWLLRKSQLLHAAGGTHPTAKPTKFSHNVWIMGHSMVYDEKQMNVEYQRCLDAGHEGAMLKNPDAPHVFKRTTDLVKLKPEDARTGRIVEVLPGEDANAAVAKAVVKKVTGLMCQYGEATEQPPYLHCSVGTRAKAQQLISAIKEVIEGDNENRISRHREGHVSFRAGERLGRFVVELDNGQTVRVGGGFTTKAGNDQRTEFWRKRDELIGMMIDFKQQKGDTADAVSRFPGFVRLREDR
ncbi:hypothetical protein LCGC14_0829580 [marine sediment metagenome]|uniref:ATP-dependent DNA ligase family profile domain-containing protein n=1 Tax=marine sediment metagenome TaxID=412755 RepID=A0A0F9SNQ9_9ZZZZ